MSENCGSCRFSREYDGELDCHRHAPRPYIQVMARGPSWSAVEPSDWCGDYWPRETLPPTLSDFDNWAGSVECRVYMMQRHGIEMNNAAQASIQLGLTIRDFLHMHGFPK